MHEWESLSHVRWDCKYHVVIVPKYRKRVLYGRLKRELDEILRDLARQKGIDIEEEHLMADHVHMCLKIPPKFSVAFVLGFMKGKSAVRIHRKAVTEGVTGMHYWSWGYCVSTVGLDEATIKKYIREQEKKEKDQLNLFE